jgi:hypothetical protein
LFYNKTSSLRIAPLVVRAQKLTFKAEEVSLCGESQAFLGLEAKVSYYMILEFNNYYPK